MPITYIDIEKQKTWRISIFFLFLMVLYFLVVMTLVQGALFFFPIHFIFTGSFHVWNSPKLLLSIFGISLMMAGIHFGFSAFGAVRSLMKQLGALSPDPGDGIHGRLLNVVDEIHVVTGGTRKIECMVIPSLSLNAIAASDLNGNAVIAITEGLLSRLTRPQLEAVLAHEAYHILSGDCIEATVATSLFGMYSAALENIEDIGKTDPRMLLPFTGFWVLTRLSQVLSMFISREREYRADAASVRMTRNPVAMAEALFLISRNWRGTGLIGSGLEMLCIIDPKDSETEESEGFLEDLMSTHPPIRKRIQVLLNMVRKSYSDMKKRIDEKEERNTLGSTSDSGYYALDRDQKWQGPYNPSDLVLLPWFSPRNWIRKSAAGDIERASEDDRIKTLFSEHMKTAHQKHLADLMCPLCRQPLLRIPYERTYVFRCHYCKGSLVDNDKISRIIARKGQGCPERLTSLAKAVMSDNQKRIANRSMKGRAIDRSVLTPCPKCLTPMMRTFYSLAYLIEIDRCSRCSVTWFDHDELEMLQCVIENRMTAQLNLI
jgi:heat shock protein HtpX